MTKPTFSELVDLGQIQRMLEAHYSITGVQSAIVDNDEMILVAVGWQDICTQFHRVHPVTSERCRESDAFIKSHLSDSSEECLDYRCRNGLRDLAVPIIIAGQHLATLFTGQFFYDDDKPDTRFFQTQAREFGFCEESYLEALKRVPVFTREQIRNIMDYYRNLVHILADMGLKNLELVREIEDRRRSEELRRKLEYQLLQSQKMESIGLLAGGVAHDFNNMLVAISGFGRIIQERIPPNDDLLRESIGIVLNAAERAEELTRGLLAFSRKQVMNPEPVSLETIFDQTCKLMKRIVRADIEISTSFPAKKLCVKADIGQIEQVLMNLTANACDAMPHGGRLTISADEVFVREGFEAGYELSSPGSYALISVSDTGMGIDMNVLDKVFEPFFTTKETGKGTGLGLSIAHGIIKQHDGSITVESEPGKGTIFNIYLPLTKDCELKKIVRTDATPAGGRETVLVAEDEEFVRHYVKKTLERAGYKVLAAEDGEHAMALFKNHQEISLVLTDIVMPNKGGEVMVAEIKRIKPEIKTLFMSGYTADVVHGEGITGNGTDLLIKPFSKNDLLWKIREVLDQC